MSPTLSKRFGDKLGTRLQVRCTCVGRSQKGLVYSKSKGKAPFQTWQQIEQRIKRGNLSAVEQNDLWENLFLTLSEIDECLDHVKKTSRFGLPTD